jgi:uncharacterized protein with PIN domain
MPTARETLKAQLLAQAEAAIDELLAKKKAPAIASLADIEHVVHQAGDAIQEAMTTALLQESGAELTAQWPTCPTCGQRLLAKGKRSRRVATTTGEVVVVRDYYYCRHCRKGIFPPG